jgi:hypothetical protein
MSSSTYTLNPSGSAYGNVTIAGGGGGGGTYSLAGAVGAGNTYTMPWTGAGAGNNWSVTQSPVMTLNAGSSPSLQVSGDADIRGNLTVNGANISEILEKIQERLAILVPDPKRLEKYEALKQAYDNYKLLEALCVDETNSKK